MIRSFALLCASFSLLLTPVQATVLQVAPQSFESFAPGPFRAINLGVLGTLEVLEGRAAIHPNFGTGGSRCLHLPAGPRSVVDLNFREPLADAARLTFKAERWTVRPPWLFTLQVLANDTWAPLYDGSALPVGRELLANIAVDLPKGTLAIRFSCEAPENAGLLIDDVAITPAKPMVIQQISSTRAVNPIYPSMPHQPLMHIDLPTDGGKHPLLVHEVEVAVHGSLSNDRITALSLLQGGKPLVETTATGARMTFTLSSGLPLKEGSNRLTVAATLVPTVTADATLGASLVRLRVGDTWYAPTPDVPNEVNPIASAIRVAGQDGVHTYRIPALATTKKGTLLATYDVRRRAGGDLPGDIDVGLSRSEDHGRTWSDMIIVMDMGDDPKWAYDGVGDPAILVDEQTGRIWIAATWSHGKRSWHGSGPGMTPEETGQVMLAYSDDDGRTWSKPINITEQVKIPEWHFVLPGPGRGITMKDGTLVFPAQYRDAQKVPHSTIFTSQDRGQTWRIGAGVKTNTTEAQVVELANGELMINCRDDRGGWRSVYTSNDLGATWKEHPTTRNTLAEPVCNAGLLRIGNRLYFSNPPQARGRYNLTVKVSEDMGMTWPEKWHLLVEERDAQYSSLSPTADGALGLLYERQGHILFVRIPLDALHSAP